MEAWKIYALVLVPTVGIGLIFKYLININKIKPNKISKQFYYDDESFINSWKETVEKGFLRYILKNTVIMTVFMSVIGVFFILNKRGMFGFEQEHTWLVIISMGFVLGFIDSLISWIYNQDRDSRLKEKAIVRNDNINKDN